MNNLLITLIAAVLIIGVVLIKKARDRKEVLGNGIPNQTPGSQGNSGDNPIKLDEEIKPKPLPTDADNHPPALGGADGFGGTGGIKPPKKGGPTIIDNIKPVDPVKEDKPLK